MVYVRTCAYNAEKTLVRTIESILNQTHKDFLYYLLDNGSTDETREIIRSYAKKDKRIVPFYSERNHDYTESTEFWNLFYDLQEGDYLCSLDADDAYGATFLEDTLRFSRENKLDIAMCGTVFMEADSWQPCGERVLHENVVIGDRESFDDFFPVIYWNLRQTWGKLYSAKAARMPYMINKPEWYPRAYGGDTINTFEAVKLSSRIGVLAKPLHYYAISSNSVSHRWVDGREKSDSILFKKAEELLLEKCGVVSPRNLDFIYSVYFNALNDTFRTLFHSEAAAEKKINVTKDIFFHPITQKMFHRIIGVPNEERIDFFVNVVINLLNLWQDVSESSFTVLAEIFADINPDFKQLVTKESFAWYMENNSVIMRNVVLREYEYAVNNLIVYLNKKDVQPSRDFPYILGQQLAAVRNEEEKYVYFSKHLIRWYILNNRRERAQEELNEWLQMLPEDEDLKALQRLYNKNQ